MQLSQRQVDIIEALYGLNIDLARGDDDQRRQLTKKIAEQIRFEFGPRWGTKSTTVNHPQSKDAIAYDNQDGTIDVWDWQNGSSREPQVNAGDEPSHPRLVQFFIAVEPVNHLSSEPGNGGGNGDEDDVVIELLKGIDDKLKQLHVQHESLLAGQSAIINVLQVLVDKPTPDVVLPPIKFPEYEANTFFGRITLKPKP